MVKIEELDDIERARMHLSILNSLRQFDRLETEPVAVGLLSPSRREQCLLYLYFRAQRNIDSLLALTDTAHFQAVAMLGRAVFELCVDITLFEKTPDAELRMLAFKDLELLRAARTLTKFEEELGEIATSAARAKFLRERTPTIESIAAGLWQRKVSDISHWTGEKLPIRVKRASAELRALYVHSYRQFSWHVHSGLEGVFDAPPEQVTRTYGMGLSLAALSYRSILEVMGSALLITKHDDSHLRKLKYAFELPFADSVEDERTLLGHNGLQ